MTLLGIDVGLTKTGVARAVSGITEPFLVIRERNVKRLAHKIVEIARVEDIKVVVVGMPEGELATRVQELGNALQRQGVVVRFWDETLTTQDAELRSIEAGITRKKRKVLEDAFAAALMLQSYIDSKISSNRL